MIATTESTLVREAWSTLATVDDPEYPGISIVDLGLVESVELVGGDVHVGLIPTFSGCPALAMIADDVRETVGSRVHGAVVVEWLRSPVWTIERVSDVARTAMAEEFTVAVQIGRTTPVCPRCGAPTEQQSMFGPNRCRSVHRCTGCNEAIEVMRS
ncbi:MAG: iron-sulfur cluster assembly protein [Acidimicrobiales bacterium]